jgi:hypothetical protein
MFRKLTEQVEEVKAEISDKSLEQDKGSGK